MKNQSCRTCRFLEVKPGARRYEFYAYPCLAPIPEMPKMPESVGRGVIMNWPKQEDHRYTCPNYGQDCQAYEKLKKVKNEPH